MFPEALAPEHRTRARELTQKLGARLADEGYRGLLEIDYLVDTDTDELYLGELNPRLSGISSMTNVSASAYADVPLFLFHLLEYLDTDYELDVDDVNRRWSSHDETDDWSQLILKEPDDGVELLTVTPATGVWRLDDGGGIGSAASATTGTACTTTPRASTCACSLPATTATRAPTSASSSPAGAFRPRTTS